MPDAVEALVRDLARYRAATREVHNRSVFEMPGILQSSMAQARVYLETLPNAAASLARA